MKYKIKQFIVDPGRFELTENGEAVALQPQALRLLIVLLEADGSLVTKDKLIDRVWDGRVISDSAISSQIKAPATKPPPETLER